MKKPTQKLVPEKGMFVAEHGELHYFKQKGVWHIHGSQFSKTDHALYSVACPKLYMELENVKIPWEETASYRKLQEWYKTIERNTRKHQREKSSHRI